MAFLNHINSEHIFYREANKHFKEYLSTITRKTYYSNYEKETRETIILPSTESGICHAIQAIINWACCNEALLNAMLYQAFRFNNEEEYKSATRLSIAKRITLFNTLHNNTINTKLAKRILLLAGARNQYVHYDDIPIYCGGDIFSEEFKTLSLNNMLIFKAAVSGLAQIARNLSGINLRDTSYPLYGDGDLEFPETVEPIILKKSVIREINK